jgi:CRP-like cAMP-binding protein
VSFAGPDPTFAAILHMHLHRTLQARRRIVSESQSSSSTAREPALGAELSFNVAAFAARLGGVKEAKLKAGALLYAQGEPANCLYFIEKGQVQVSVLSTQGKAAIVGLLNPGDCCGDGCLIGERPRLATATCITDATVERLERANVIRAIQQDPPSAEFYVKYALSRTARLTDRLLSQLIDSSEQRLARLLLFLADYGKNGGRGTVIGNLDQESLAQMIGTTRSRVNFFMNKFRDLGYIEYDGDIVVHDSQSKIVSHQISIA